jgi:aspartate/methionine/tyrosine aminotransferase
LSPTAWPSTNRRRAEFKARRDWFIPELDRLGLDVPVMPDGAFYAWADVSGLCERWNIPLPGSNPEAGGSWALAFELMQRCQIATTPGAISASAEPWRYLRFSTANSMAQLQEAMARLEQRL